MATTERNLTLMKESLNSIFKQLAAAPKARPSNDLKSLAAKIHNLLLQENTQVERFYFIFLICQLCGNVKTNKVDKLLKLLLPANPSAHTMALISDLVSFALCHPSNYTAILDNMSTHLNSYELVNVDVESWTQAESLALESPDFCAALISRPDLSKMGIDKRLLAKWLQDLSKIDEEFAAPSLSQLIRYSLFQGGSDCDTQMDEEKRHNLELANSDLHFGILTLIQSKKCQTLTNQFLIDVATNLAQQTSGGEQSQLNTDTTTKLVDRFAQILTVAATSKVTTITNALRNTLTRLDSNQLIASVIRWQNK